MSQGARPANRVSFLLKRGFALTPSAQDDRATGDSCFVLESEDLRVRILRDRGQDFVEVAPTYHPEEWFDLSLLLQAFGAKNSPIELTDLEIEAALLERVLPELQKAFRSENWEATYRELRELQTQRIKERLPGLRIHPSK